MPASAAPRSTPTHASDVLHRLGITLSRWWPSRQVPAVSTRQVQLLALVSPLDEAVDAQPAADRAVAACGEPGPVPASAAQDAGQQNTVYHRLMIRLRGLRVDNNLLVLQERASRLLTYQEWMLHQAVNLATSLQTDARVEAARLRLNGLGAPAADLRELRDEVRAMAEHSCHEQAPP